jgi:hypothetical protein
VEIGDNIHELVPKHAFKVASEVGRHLPSRFQLSKWLTYRRCIRSRMEVIVEDDKETIVFVKTGYKYTQDRFRNGVARSRTDMAIEALAYFESLYVLNQKELTPVDRDFKKLIAEMTISLAKPKNQLDIAPLFPFIRFPSDTPIHKILDGIPTFFKLFDHEWFNQKTGSFETLAWYEDNVFKRSADNSIPGIAWDSKKIFSLKARCIQVLSFYNRMFTGDKLGPYTVSSVENIYPTKIVDLVKKFDTHTRMVENPSPMLGRLLAAGLNRMYDYMDVKKWFGKLVWKLNYLDILHMEFPGQSSSGIRAGPVQSYIDELGMKHTKTPNGTKADQAVPCKERMMYYLQQFKDTQDIRFVELGCCICLKHEIFNNSSIDPEVRLATYNKCREFFIPHMMQYIIAFLTMKDRQMFERGRMIKVGHRWWHGGAWELAKQMKYFDTKMVYSDGDFKGLDVTIVMFLLGLYETQAAVYIDREHSDNSLFDALLKIATNCLCAKISHIVGQVWKVIFGIMPSGAFETSHGNSWIVGLLWWAYVEYVLKIFPHRAVQIEECFRDGLIEFPVYGDDHFPGVHESIVDIVNEDGYAEFVEKFFKMKIHKIRRNIPFISVPDLDGGLAVKGVVFLKTYFIERPSFMPDYLPPILPYRDLSDVIVKIAWGNNPRWSFADYAIASIGLAYDARGTNLIIHDLCERMFLFCWYMGGFNKMEDLRDAYSGIEADPSRKDVTRIMRKCGITTDQLFKGFPMIEELWNMHTYDSAYVNFTPEFKRYSPAEVKEWENKFFG